MVKQLISGKTLTSPLAKEVVNPGRISACSASGMLANLYSALQ